MKIEKIKGDNLIIVKYKHSMSVLFAAYLNYEIEKRADIANLIVNHFKETGYEISIECSEKRYTPFIIKLDGETHELIYSCVPYYIVNP